MALTEKLTAIGDAIRSRSGKTEKLTLDQMPGEIIDLQSLNFEVVENPQPENPKGNTIWVDTDAEITGWVFSAEEPASPVEGMVWFPVGTASSVAFNALKKNTVMVYPLSAKQYVGGAFADKTAKSRVDDRWVEWFVWSGQLYQGGNEFENYTGGWYASKNNALSANSEAVVTKNEDNIRLSFASGGRKTAILATHKPIDLSGYDQVSFNGFIHPGTGAGSGKEANGYLYVYKDNNGTLESAGRVTIPNNGTAETVTLDVSSMSGEYYVCPHIYAYDSVNCYLQMNSLILT